MIYEFLYNSKPMGVSAPIILFSITFIWSAICGILCYMHLKEIPKDIRKDVQKYVISKYILLSSLFNVAFVVSSAIYVYDKVTTPNENTKTTDLYRITKEKDFLTFSAKKPYNHLYRTKTMEITYANSGEYVIVTDHQAYKIPKESVSE